MSKNHQSELPYRKNPAVVCSELDQGAILLDLNTKYYYNLNETALKIWKTVDGSALMSEIVKRIVHEYAVDEEVAEQSVRRIMTEFCKEGLLITQ